MKTPEELAQEYIDKEWSWKGEWNNQAAYSFRAAFLAGYAAAIQTTEENMKPNKLSRAFESVENPHRIRCHGAWVSVKEELPAADVEVLVVYFGSIDIGKIEYVSTDPGQFHFTSMPGSNYIDRADKVITHWMPLPPLPNE